MRLLPYKALLKLKEMRLNIISLMDSIKRRRYIKAHPEYCILFSKESDRRLKEYIDNCDVRMKRIAAESIIGNASNIYKTINKYDLSESEIDLLPDLMASIRIELNIM